MKSYGVKERGGGRKRQRRTRTRKREEEGEHQGNGSEEKEKVEGVIREMTEGGGGGDEKKSQTSVKPSTIPLPEKRREGVRRANADKWCFPL